MPRVKYLPEGFDLAQALEGVSIDRSQAMGPQIYAALRHRIVDGRLPGGTPIHENDIASLCLVSRTPLRSALQQLVNEGLIVTKPQVGSIVAPPDRSRLEEALFVRSAIEQEVVRRLATIGLDEAALAPVIERQAAAAQIDDYASFFDADEEFHFLLARMADVPNAWQLVHSIKAHVDRERFLLLASTPGRSRQAYDDHLRMLEAIRSRDGECAARVMGTHVRSVLSA